MSFSRVGVSVSRSISASDVPSARALHVGGVGPQDQLLVLDQRIGNRSERGVLLLRRGDRELRCGCARARADLLDHGNRFHRAPRDVGRFRESALLLFAHRRITNESLWMTSRPPSRMLDPMMAGISSAA